MNIQDRRKTLTAEDLRRRYNLDALDKDRKAIKLQKDQLNKVDAELNTFVETTTKSIEELQNQVDGNITTWFFNGVPTMETEPTSNWITDTDKNNHLGDLYYDQNTGYAYRFYLDGTTNEYGWMQVVDSEAAEALAIANAAKDTADSKRRVFVVQPIPPYDIGDIWIKEDTDLYRCRASRSDGNFNNADWIRATNYTDDAVALGTKAELDQFKTTVTENYVTNATLETTTNSITGRVEETYTYITTVESQVNDITQTTNLVESSNELYITDSLESNALEYHIEGKSIQDGTPTPEAPVEIKTIPSIRNLFDYKKKAFLHDVIETNIENGKRIEKATSGTCFAAYIIKDVTNDVGKTFTLNASWIANSSNVGRVALGLCDAENGNRKVGISNDVSGESFSYTIPELDTSTYLSVWLYADTTTNGAEGDYIDFTNIMLEEGTTTHSYAPCGTRVKIKTTGKNLFDKDSVIDGYELETDGFISTNKYYFVSDYIKVKPDTSYVIPNRIAFGTVIVEYDADKNESAIINGARSFVTSSNTKYLRLSNLINNKNIVQLEEGTEATEYEPYKEKEILIDLSKPNLFNKDNVTIVNAVVENTIRTSPTGKSFYMPITGGKTYTISKVSSARFRIGTTNELPTMGMSITGLITNDSASSISIETVQTAKYLCVYYYLRNTDKIYTEEEILDSIKICEGYADCYELSSIGNIKDELNIINGRVEIDKKIDKIDSYNGEIISTDYISTTGQLTTGATVYYELPESQQIILPNTNIELYEGVNHISLVDDLETTTSIKYYRNTPIAQDYVIQQQLDETNNNLANTTNQTNQNASDINTTNINLNNNYYNKDQIDVMNTSTQEIVTQIKNTVETTTTATNLQISILQQQLTNGVTKVDTGTGYTFDINGLKIQKTDSEMSSLLDNDGLVVKRNTTEVLTVRSSGVETENLKVRTYFTIGSNTRVENYKNGTGFFFIGGEE